MYTSTGYGCSYWLHLLAAYPRTVLTLGLTGALALMGAQGGHAPRRAELDARFGASAPASETDLANIARAREMAATHPLSDAQLESVLKACADCSEVEASKVRADPKLLEKVQVLYYLQEQAAR